MGTDCHLKDGVFLDPKPSRNPPTIQVCPLKSPALQEVGRTVKQQKCQLFLFTLGECVLLVLFLCQTEWYSTQYWQEWRKDLVSFPTTYLLAGIFIFLPGGFTIQSYKGAQKPSPMELMRAQATRMPEDPVTFKPPKMDIPVTEGRKQSPHSHNIKPRDLNVLTPTGF